MTSVPSPACLMQRNAIGIFWGLIWWLTNETKTNPFPEERGLNEPSNYLSSNNVNTYLWRTDVYILMEVLKNTDGFYAYFISERSPLGFGKFLTCSPKTFPSPSLELVQSHKTEKLEKFHNFLTSSNAQHLYQDVWWNLHSLIVKGSCLPVLPQQTEICQLTLLKNMLFFFSLKIVDFKTI